MNLLLKNKRGTFGMIDLDALLILIIWIIYFDFPLYSFMPNLANTCLNLIKIVYLIFLALYFFCHTYKGQIGAFEGSMVAFLLCGLVISIRNGGLSYFISGYAYPFVMSFLIFQFMFYEKALTKIRYIAGYYILAIWVNFFLMILFPRGVITSSMNAITERANWLLGSKNQVSNLIPLMLLVILIAYDEAKKIVAKKIIYLTTMIVFLLSVIFMGSSGVQFMGGSSVSIIMIFVFLLAAILIQGRHIGGAINQFYIVEVVATILIMWVLLIISQGAINNDFFVLKLLGKDTGFSGRYSVWKEVLYVIKNHFWSGIGFKPVKYHVYGNKILAMSTYSFWLQILSKEGIIGFCSALIMFIAVILPKCKDKRCTYFVVAIILLLIRGLQNELMWKDIISLLYFFVMFKRYIVMEGA